MFLVIIISSSTLFGSSLKTNFENNLSLVLPDTTCGLTDTVFQVSFPTCPGGSDASATIEIEGAVLQFIITWDNEETGATATGLSVGKHYVTVTDIEQCMLIDSVIIEDKPPLDYTINSTNSLCTGVSNGTISIADTSNLSYSWNTGDSINTLSNLGSGLYEVTITDTLGCTAVEIITINRDTFATLTLGGTDATCIGINDGLAIANNNLDLPGYTYLWSTNDTTNTLSNIGPGTYFVLVTSPEGCLAADSINIIAMKEFNIDLTANNATCVGVNDGSIIVNDSSDLTGFLFGWSTGDTTQTVTGLAAGTYTVAVADTSGCIAAAAAFIENTRTFTISTTVTDASCDEAANGTITVNDTSDVTGFNFNWSNGDTTQRADGLIAGNYKVTVTDNEGCQTIDSASVVTTPTFTITTVGSDATCSQVNDGTVSFTASSDANALNIIWSTGDSTQTVTGLAAGTYYVTVSDVLSCSQVDSVSIGTGTPFTVDISTTNPLCNGVDNGSITINDSTGIGGLSIVWSTGDSTQTISGLPAGDYQYTITDTDGCTDEGSVTLTETTNISVSNLLTKTDVSCGGLSDGAILNNNPNGNDGFSYVWSTGDSTNSLTNLGVGTYEVTVTDAAGCFSTASFTIVAANTFSINLSATNVSCSGLSDGTAIVNEGTDASALAINWSTGDSTQIASNLGIGSYSISVTDENGCIAHDTIEIAADSSLLIGLTGNNINCIDVNDGRVVASVIGLPNNDGLTFNWSTGDTTSVVDSLAPGEYVVTITDPTGCFGVGGVNLAEADSIQLNFVLSDIECIDTIGSGAILAVATGGSGSFTYEWSTGATSNTIVQLLEGTYHLTVTDSLGCTLVDSATLVNPPALLVDAAVTQDATCGGTLDGIASVLVSGGATPYNIQWSNGLSTPTISNLNPGIYTVEVTDAKGCMDTDTITIGEVTAISVSTEELNSASGSNVADGIALATASGGAAPYTYNWDNGATGATVNTLSPGLHDVVATDANGCTGTGSVDMRFFNLNVTIIETEDLSCFGDMDGRATAAPAGTPPYQYLWSTGDTLPILTSLPAGTHSVTVTDSLGMRGVASVTLTSPEEINFNLEIILPGCPNSSNGRITFNPTGLVGSPQFDFGAGISNNPVILGISTGTKTYGIIDANGCRVDTTFVIESLSPNLPAPAFTATSLGLAVNFTESSTNEPTEYLWKFGDGTTSSLANPIHEYPDTGTYEVCLIVSNACGTDSLCQNLLVNPIPVPGVELNFGRDTSSLSGQMVSIPVTVGAFEDISAIAGTFELSNPSVATIEGIRSLNLPELTTSDLSFQSNLITLDWAISDSSDLVTLPIGTQIFVIDLLLTGNSNECTEIVATNSEIALQFSKSFMGQIIPAPFVINSAEICVAPTVSIAGNISREAAGAVAGVVVTTNDEVTSTTLADGNYGLSGLPGGSTFIIEPTKSDDLLDGVTTFDVVRILRHILTESPLDSPYKVIAADIDNSGTVTSLDLVQLQRLLLQKIDAFPNNQPWRFVPISYQFNNPTNPLLENFPETLELTRLEVDTANIDFVAIKTGDVINTGSGDNARFIPKSMGFEIKDKTFKAGDLVQVPFYLHTKDAALGFQLELAFDNNKLVFIGAADNIYLPMSNNNFGTKNIENGRLKMLWINQNNLSFRPMKDGLFELEFSALKDGQLSEVIRLANDVFAPQFYSKQGQQIGLQNIALKVSKANLLEEEDFIATNTANNFLLAGENEDTPGGCTDGIDNDNDNLVDCADADCYCECNTGGDSGNLLRNPGAEVAINSDDWEIVQGTWGTRSADPDPQEGNAYFFQMDSISETGQLTQTIDLIGDSAAIAAGSITYIFSGYVRSLDEDPTDQAQLILEFRNAQDSVVQGFDSGLVTITDEWQLFTDTTVAPQGATIAIIYLIARKKNGDSNDVYFDNFYFGKIDNTVCVDPCGGVDLLTIVSPATAGQADGEASTTLAGSTGPILYSWSNGATTPTIDSLSAGIYSVIASDSIGCTAMDSIIVPLDSTLLITLSSTPPICSGDNTGSISVQIIGGTAPFTYVWSDSTLVGDTLQNLVAGTYQVTVLDANGTDVSAEAILGDGNSISLNSEDSKVINESCPSANDGQLSLVAEGGTAPYIYIVNGDTTDNGVYLNLTAGTYPISITDASGCATTASISIETAASGSLDASFNSILNDENNSIALASVTQDSALTYNWTFGNGTTSTEMNPTVTYADAGSYEICLILNNECGSDTTCQTLEVGIIGPVRFIVNSLNGIANDTVIIPVTVQNFKDVASFQKTIQVQDTSIARIIGVSDPNQSLLTASNFFQVDDFTVTSVWYDETGMGQELPNNTVLYNLMVMVNTDIDTCVGINIVDSPVPSQVVGVLENMDIAEVPFEIVNGEICTKETAEITGIIARETGSGVSGVQINVTNFDKTPTSDGEGEYMLEKLSINNSYEITPFLNTPLLESVSTFDIVLINRHILRNRLLDSPYKYIAADVNQSGNISVFDLVLIQRAILGLNSDFPGNNAWRFIPTSYVFSDPTNPFAEDFPESLTVNNISGDLGGQDFVAIKVADVSYTVPSTNATSAGARSSQQLSLNVDNQHFTMGKNLLVPIITSDLIDLSGFQLEIDFDQSKLEFVDIHIKELPGFNQNNIGVKYLKQGKIQLIWVAPEVEMNRKTTTLFDLEFKAKTSGRLQESLSLGKRFLSTESYTKDLTIGSVALAFNKPNDFVSNELAVFPNPTTGMIDLTFDNPTSERVQILVYNFTGQLVKELKDIKEDRVQLNLGNHANGTYLLMLKRSDGYEVKRVVLNQ